jgi:hypothetical protein
MNTPQSIAVAGLPDGGTIYPNMRSAQAATAGEPIMSTKSWHGSSISRVINFMGHDI